MPEGTWRTETEHLQLTIYTEGEEISDVPGAVTFDRGERLGEACNRPVPTLALGSRGEDIVTRVRQIDGVSKIRISPHTLTVKVTTRLQLIAARREVRVLMKKHVGPEQKIRLVTRAPLARDIKAGRQPSPLRHCDFEPLPAA